MFSFDMSNTVSPGVSSILSLIVSRFSSGYFSKDVLFVVYIAVIYHVCPDGTKFVVRLHLLAAISMSPSWSAARNLYFGCMPLSVDVLWVNIVYFGCKLMRNG